MLAPTLDSSRLWQCIERLASSPDEWSIDHGFHNGPDTQDGWVACLNQPAAADDAEVQTFAGPNTTGLVVHASRQHVCFPWKTLFYTYRRTWRRQKAQMI